MLSISIGPLSLPFDRLLLLMSFAVALFVGYIVGRKYKQSADGSLATIFIVAMLVSRVSFVIQYWQEYDWLTMLDIRDAGFDPWAGTIAGVLLFGWYCWRQPKKRRSLLSGVMAGMLVWGLTMTALWVIRDTSQQLPKLVLSELGGETIELNAVESGKPRVINLWATWCPPCRREMPALEQAQRNQPEVGFVFVNQGEHQAVIEQFLRNEGLKLDNMLIDNKAMLGQLVGSRALPTTLFVDKDGKLVDAHLGELSRASLAAKLNKLKQTIAKKQLEN